LAAEAPARSTRARLGGPGWTHASLTVLVAASLLLAVAWPDVPARPAGRLVLLLATAGLLLTWPLGWLRRLRLARAARRLPAEAAKGTAPLAWLGLRERNNHMQVRCGHISLRTWTIPLGVAAGGWLLLWMGGTKLEAADLAVGAAVALLATLALIAWGPSGWRLVLDGGPQSLVLIRFGPFRRIRDYGASLPTVQAVRLDKDRRSRAFLTVQLTRGQDWHLDLPADWPPELGQALAGRLAHLAGIEVQPVPEQTTSPPEAVAAGGVSKTEAKKEEGGS
jgi:hypothetical protein